MPIPDCCVPEKATPYPLTVTVPNGAITGAITKVTATLTGLTHGATGDLDVLLVAPGGQSTILLSDTGVSASGATVTFDDTAPGTVSNLTPIAPGTYKPTNGAEDCPGMGDVFPAPAPSSGYGSTMSALNASAPNGTWSLYVVDDCEVDAATPLATGFSLTITAGNSGTFSAATGLGVGDCCPATPSTLYPSTINVSGTNGTITGVTVTVNNLTHGRTSDLNVLLVGPNNQAVLLLSDAGRAATNATVTFNDAAGSGVPPNATISGPSGPYTPTNLAEDCATGSASDHFPAPAPPPPYATSLSVFNGIDADGAWSAYITDDCATDTGQVASGWTVEFAGPTSVSVSSFSAKRAAKGVTIRWRTAQEVSLLGFNVLRSTGARFTKVNKLLVPAKRRVTGAAYSFVDRTARKGVAYTYRLQSVGMDGSKRIRGTVKVKAR